MQSMYIQNSQVHNFFTNEYSEKLEMYKSL